MRNERRLQKKQKTCRRIIMLLASVVLLVGIMIGGTIAFLVDQTEDIKNVFSSTQTTVTIDEVIEGGVKKNVKVTNTGEISAYIRANVIVSWVDTSDNAVVYAGTPVAGTDYEASFPEDSGWVKGSDGFWYYTKPVAAGASTGILLTDCKQLETAVAPEGASLSVEILVQSVQAQGTGENAKKPVELTWGINPETLQASENIQ